MLPDVSSQLISSCAINRLPFEMILFEASLSVLEWIIACRWLGIIAQAIIPPSYFFCNATNQLQAALKLLVVSISGNHLRTGKCDEVSRGYVALLKAYSHGMNLKNAWSSDMPGLAFLHAGFLLYAFSFYSLLGQSPWRGTKKVNELILHLNHQKGILKQAVAGQAQMNIAKFKNEIAAPLNKAIFQQ